MSYSSTKNQNRLSYTIGLSNVPLIPNTIGQQLEQASDLYSDRESFIFSQSGDRLTFKTLKQKASYKYFFC